MLTETASRSLDPNIERDATVSEDSCSITVLGTDPGGAPVVFRSCSESFSPSSDSSRLRRRVDRLLTRARYDDLLTEYAELAARRGAIEATTEPKALADDDEYDEVRDRSRRVRSELEELLSEFEVRDFDAAFATPDFSGNARIQPLG